MSDIVRGTRVLDSYRLDLAITSAPAGRVYAGGGDSHPLQFDWYALPRRQSFVQFWAAADGVPALARERFGVY